MASIVLDISGALKELERINGGLQNQTSLFKSIADSELSETLLRFRSETDPEGKKWAASNTIRRDGGGGRGPYTREQSWNYVLKSNYHAVPPGWHWFDRSRGDKALTDTGTLRRSIGISYGPDYGIVGTNLEYAKRNQEGDGVRKREFLGVSKRTISNVENILQMYIKGLLK